MRPPNWESRRLKPQADECDLMATKRVRNLVATSHALPAQAFPPERPARSPVSIAASTRARVASATTARSFRTAETVPTATPRSDRRPRGRLDTKPPQRGTLDLPFPQALGPGPVEFVDAVVVGADLADAEGVPVDAPAL